MKYLLQADWERLVKNAERYEALAGLVGENDPEAIGTLMGLPRAHINRLMDEQLDRQADNCMRRAGGAVICTTCGKSFREHPQGGPLGYDGEQFLNRLCDGTLVKL
jgi:hypothetical protein